MDTKGNVIKGVAYQDLPQALVVGSLMVRFGSYILTASEDRYAGYITLLFAQDKTDAAANMAVRTNVETRDGIYWDPILKDLRFIPVSYPYTQVNFSPGGTSIVQQAARYVIRQVYIPGTSKGTRVTTRIFQSPVPFRIPQWEAPQPTEVTFHYINLSGGFPSCLHKYLSLEDLLGAIGDASSGGNTPTPEFIAGQKFAATNFIEWPSFIHSDTQKLVNGVWVRTQEEYTPPDEPATITAVQSS